MSSNWKKIILIILCISFFIGCPKAEDIHELVGLWQMVKYTSIIGGVTAVEVGETLEQDSSTIEFGADNSFESTDTESGETYIYAGTWDTIDGTLTMTMIDENTEVLLEQTYTVSGNTLTLEWVESSYSTHIWEYRRK